MDWLVKILAFILVLASLPVVATDLTENTALACEAGPIQREFDASAWNIYACSDAKSVVVVPLQAIDGEFGYFFVTPEGQGVTVVGEGWGQDSSFQPVFQRLQQVTASELAAIVQAAQAAKPAASPAG
ncbi:MULTISPECIES: hypothetical protein [unclassified Luteimonas]